MTKLTREPCIVVFTNGFPEESLIFLLSRWIQPWAMVKNTFSDIVFHFFQHELPCPLV